MSNFQLLGARINLGGDARSVVVRGKTRPLTLPEVYLLRVIHHGEANVFDLMDVGEVDRTQAEERSRLESLYGRKLVNEVFPGAVTSLPERDETLLTLEEHMEARSAANAVLNKAKGRRHRKPPVVAQPPHEEAAPAADAPVDAAPDAAPDIVPDLVPASKAGHKADK